MPFIRIAACLLGTLLISTVMAEMTPDDFISVVLDEIDAKRISCPKDIDIEGLRGLTCARPRSESDFTLFEHRWKLAIDKLFGENPPPGIPWQQRDEDTHIVGYRISGADVIVVHQVLQEKLTLLLGWRKAQ